MATYISTTFGKISGRFGEAVAYNRNGKQIIRRYVVPRNPRTEKQQAHRRKFAMVQTSLKVLREAIAFGYGRKTDYCKAVSHAMNNAVKGFYTHQSIDYAQVQVSKGSIPKSYMQQVSIVGNTLTLTWDTTFSSGKNANNEVHVVLLNSSIGIAKLIHTGVRRCAGSVTISLPPSAPEGTFQVWVFFSNGKERSDSMYAGSVNYSVREKREMIWPDIAHHNKQKERIQSRLKEVDHHMYPSDSKCRDIPLYELACKAVH